MGSRAKFHEEKRKETRSVYHNDVEEYDQLYIVCACGWSTRYAGSKDTDYRKSEHRLQHIEDALFGKEEAT